MHMFTNEYVQKAAAAEEIQSLPRAKKYLDGDWVYARHFDDQSRTFNLFQLGPGLDMSRYVSKWIPDLDQLKDLFGRHLKPNTSSQGRPGTVIYERQEDVYSLEEILENFMLGCHLKHWDGQKWALTP